MTTEEEDAQKLTALEQAFDRGDYRAVRDGTADLLRQTKDGDVKKGAAALRARTEADPLVKWLFVMAAGVIVLVTAWWLTHQPR